MEKGLTCIIHAEDKSNTFFFNLLSFFYQGKNNGLTTVS